MKKIIIYLSIIAIIGGLSFLWAVYSSTPQGEPATEEEQIVVEKPKAIILIDDMGFPQDMTWGEAEAMGEVVGATITTIEATDKISASRTTINTNFTNLNTDKLEISGGTMTGMLTGTILKMTDATTTNATSTYFYISDSLTIGAYTFPNTDGTVNYVLKTDGSGSLTWQADSTGTGLSNLNSETLGSIGDVSTTTLAYGSLLVWDTSNWVSSSTQPYLETEWNKLYIATTTWSGNLTIDGDLNVSGNMNILDADVPDTITASNYLSLTNWYATTTHALISSLPSLATVGTITSGTWQSTNIGVGYGGTGLSDPTNHAVLVGSGASAFTALTVGTNGQLLIGSTGADPVFATLNCDSNLTCTTGAGTLEIDVDDAFLLNTGDIGTGVYDFGGATSLEIPNTTNPTVDAAGEIAVDMTSASSSIRFYGAAELPLYPEINPGLPYASSTLIQAGAYGASGTTTILMGNFKRKLTLKDFYCKTNKGTASVAFGDGSATTSPAVCSTSGVLVTPASNNTWTMRENFYIEIGTQASDPDIITVSPNIQYIAD